MVLKNPDVLTTKNTILVYLDLFLEGVGKHCNGSRKVAAIEHYSCNHINHKLQGVCS